MLGPIPHTADPCLHHRLLVRAPLCALLEGFGDLSRRFADLLTRAVRTPVLVNSVPIALLVPWTQQASCLELRLHFLDGVVTEVCLTLRVDMLGPVTNAGLGLIDHSIARLHLGLAGLESCLRLRSIGVRRGRRGLG